MNVTKIKILHQKYKNKTEKDLHSPADKDPLHPTSPLPHGYLGPPPSHDDPYPVGTADYIYLS